MSSQFRRNRGINKRVNQAVILNKKFGALAITQPKPSVRSLDKRIKKINRNVELKHEDVLLSSETFTNAGALTLLNALQTGDDDITRTGNEVQATSIQWRLRIDTDPDNLRDTTVRHMIVWDRQANGAVFTLGLVLDQSVITSPIVAPYNHDYQERFKILHDSVMIIKPSVVLSTSTGALDETVQNQASSKYTKGKRQLSRTVKYDGNAGTIADIKTNSLYSILISDTAGADPTVVGGYRFYYKDM